MKMKRENRGLTLVELMITIAIVAIVIAAATSFMVTGSRSFTKGSADSNLQKEAELTVNQIEDMVIDVNGGLDWTYDADADGNKTESKLLMYFATQEPDESGTLETKYYGEAVVWKKFDDSGEPDEKMYYSKWDVTYDSTNGFVPKEPPTDDYHLLAENVSLFEVDLDTVDETTSDGTVYQIIRGVQIRVGYENSFGDVDYATSPVITLRNRMILSDDPDEIFEVPPTVSADMKLYYSGPEFEGIVPIIDTESKVYCGKEYQIYAWLIGGTDISHLVDWEITTPNNNSSIGVSSGLLHVGANESNPYLDIVARYKTNPNKYVKGTVQVVGSNKTFKAIHITTNSLVGFTPKFGSYGEYDGFSEAEKLMTTYKWSVSAPHKVEPFVDNNSTLELKVIEADYGKDKAEWVIDITLEAHSPVTGETRYDVYQYRINQPGTKPDNGDSNNERGKLEHGDVWYGYTIDWADFFEYEVYFCDIYGNKLTNSRPGDIYDDIDKYVQIAAGYYGTYSLVFLQDLPMDKGYYVKVVCHFRQSWSGTEYSYERIHYIPPVYLYGGTCYSNGTLGKNRFTIHYAIDGFYEVQWMNANPAVYEYTIEDFNYDDGGTGVDVEAKHELTVTEGDDCTMHAEFSFTCSNWDLANKVTLEDMTIKVSLKEYPSIYTYVTVIFDPSTPDGCQKTPNSN